MTASPDHAYRRLVAALWVLVRTAGTRSAAAQLATAAGDCWQCLADVLAQAAHVVLQERAGALFANGLRIRPDVASFAATAGITALLQDDAISELLLLPDASPADLELLAQCWHESGARGGLDGLLRQRGCAGIHVAHGVLSDIPDELPIELATVSAPSQLGAVFTLQRFSAALGPVGPLSGSRARGVLQAVLHRLLRSDHGLEPLAMMQRDPVAHTEAVRACVLAVRTAQELGWDDERATTAGISALLGPAAVAPSDTEAGELARASQAVAALIGGVTPPAAALRQLQLHGQLPAFVSGAMADALAAAP